MSAWPKDCVQRVFVEGAAWWQYHHGGATAFPSERDEMEAEAVHRYGNPIMNDLPSYRKVVEALISMCEQYLNHCLPGRRDSRDLCHAFMNAGEDAVDVLVQLGLATDEPWGGRLLSDEAVRAVLDAISKRDKQEARAETAEAHVTALTAEIDALRVQVAVLQIQLATSQEELEQQNTCVAGLEADPRMALTGQHYCDLRNFISDARAHWEPHLGAEYMDDLDEHIRQSLIAYRTTLTATEGKEQS